MSQTTKLIGVPINLSYDYPYPKLYGAIKVQNKDQAITIPTTIKVEKYSSILDTLQKKMSKMFKIFTFFIILYKN